MKSAGLNLLFFIATGTLAAQTPPAITSAAPVAQPRDAPFVALAKEGGPAKTSARLQQEIRGTLPKFVTPAATQPDQTAGTEPAGPPDPDVLVLPTFKVQEKRLPSDAADHLMSRKDFKRKMENIYLDELAKDGPLNVLLNNFTIPFISPSRAARGHAIYRQRELDRLAHVNEVGRLVNPEAAGEFAREMDNSHTTRPAGK